MFYFYLAFGDITNFFFWSAVVIQVSRFRSLDNIILLKILQKDFLVFSVAQLKSVSGKFSQIGFWRYQINPVGLTDSCLFSSSLVFFEHEVRVILIGRSLQKAKPQPESSRRTDCAKIACNAPALDTLS